ncbi:MAG: glutamate-ammonia-ligase adenylyltransferase [Acidocella sp. 35-58-6]|nr:MAG: glutamate-ammonia-ligase adenylyltransferase [Acidocella sp. 35-58-6]
MKSPDTLWPPPADAQAAARLLTEFAALGRAESKFARSAQGAAVLNALGGNAPYLADLALAAPKILMQALDHPQALIDSLLARLGKIPPTISRAEISKKLRIAKRQAALTIAVADIGSTWPLAQVTLALSALAETCLKVAIRHLLRGLHDQASITLPDPAEPDQKCGFVALALGKLGAFELNYSSDIDLVLIYDPQSPVYPPDAQAIMARLARDLVSLFSTRDEHGYVFRVDLRLRPDPAATPPVISLPAALTYYESHGRTWERAAFSKARPLAGDIALGEMFLAAIRPFIWRRHLDFAAIADIRGMKRQIDAHQTASGLLDHDVKLGRGGIREIEFIVQTLSLVWGGEDPALRIPQTLKALPALARARHLPEAAARELAADYQTLRRVEHRLQMVADRQTHSLPANQETLQQFAIFLNDPGFLKSFPKLLNRVHRHFLAFFDADSGPATVIDPGETGKPPLDFTIKLKALGFSDFQHMAERLRAWSSGGIPALRSERARELLDSLVPHLLEALGRQKDPDRAFLHFDTLISRQRAGVQLLSLFARNPALLDRLAAVLGAAPVLAEHLAQDAQALEALLSPAARFAAPRPALRRLLHEATDLEGVVSITRRFVRREEFHLSVATLEGRLDANEAGRLRSNLAKAALGALLPHVMAQHIARFGRIRGMKFGIVALGKTGSAEMLAGSDLDLMLMYDHAAMDTPPTHYFVRLAHALTAALTAPGPEGPIYHVDMRLRPSGNQGPVAVSLASFRRYHAAESWTWERMALTRASVLAATPKFELILSDEILIALSRPEPAAAIRADASDMLARINLEIPPEGPWDVKHCTGGLIELAFIAEALQLIHGPANPVLFRANTAAALRALADAGHLGAADTATLLAADLLWRTIQGISRITGLHERDEHPQPATLAPLLRATGTIDVAQLTLTIEQHRAAVRDCFTRIIGPVTQGDENP